MNRGESGTLQPSQPKAPGNYGPEDVQEYHKAVGQGGYRKVVRARVHKTV